MDLTPPSLTRSMKKQNKIKSDFQKAFLPCVSEIGRGFVPLKDDAMTDRTCEPLPSPRPYVTPTPGLSPHRVALSWSCTECNFHLPLKNQYGKALIPRISIFQ